MTTKANPSPGLSDPRRKRDSFGKENGVGIPSPYGIRKGTYTEEAYKKNPTMPTKIPTKLN